MFCAWPRPVHRYKYFHSSMLVWLVPVALMILWWNHNRYGILKAASGCKSRVGVRFEKMSVVRRILVSSRAAVSKRSCLPQISRWGQAWIIVEGIWALWRFNILLTLNCSIWMQSGLWWTMWKHLFISFSVQNFPA
jgi:hypothetical protein